MQKQRDKIPNSVDPHVVIRRVLHHSRERIFEAWTNPQLLMKWYAPNGCTIRFSKIEIRENGQFQSCISHPKFGDCWVIGTYLELTRPEKIIYTMTVADEHGNPAEPSSVGHDPEWAPQSTVQIILKELDINSTELTLLQNVSEKLARKTGAYPSWLEMLDHLDSVLSTVSKNEDSQ